MTKRTFKLFSLLLAGWLLLSPALLTAWAAPGITVTISSEAEFLAFAKNCALDTWSQDKTVILTADLDLSETEFSPIPTFGGTFQGQGHTISGLCLTAAGSTQGLFRYIQPGGVVRDLTVKGTVAPEGTRSTVGGIVGDNSGTVQNCSFSGSVRGDSAVGGIAGRNSESGQIIGCSISGSVSGENATGGVAGRNLGLLLQCENSAGVNLTQTESSIDLTGEDAGAALEELAAADDDTYHLLDGCSDTGGIVGWSGGVVQSCVNSGAVGYPHVGYNTGGIAGRQSGYLAGCVNTGAIHGRKDVGGIVGQAEPYLVMDPGRDTLDRLRAELDTLDRLIDRALDDAQRTGDDVSARLEAMGGFTDDARGSSQRMLDHISDFADDNVSSINTLTADLTNALDKINPALDDLSSVGDQVEDLSGRLGDALDGLDEAVKVGDQAVSDLNSALDDLRDAPKELNTAIDQLRDALDTLHQAVFPDEGGGLPSLPSADDLKSARENLRRAFNALQRSSDSLDNALAHLQKALARSGDLSDKLGSSLDDLQDASDSAATAGRLLSRALNTISGAVSDLTENGPVEFSPLGEPFRQASNDLFDALSGLSGEMEGLNSAVKNGSDALIADLRAINSQFHTVFNVLLDAVSDMTDTPNEGVEAVIQDTSEEDIAATREGKVADCRNTGAVEGDRNVGGVIGAMAIEFDLDPEDDASDAFSFGATYETKAVLQSCINYGSITAKKDCVGGLTGRMDLGTALDCQNYGPVESTGGDYVGGVAGYADASVRNCWAKSVLSGKNYIGGVAGWASRLRDCRAIATISQGTECLGAIAGGVETDGALSNCRFVDTGVAGVDGVSYAGRAEPISFQDMSRLDGVPTEFTAFTLTLIADEKTVAQIPFLYGDDLSRVELPPVPELEGSYGVWPDFDTSGTRSDLTLEAVYTPWITLAASVEQSGKLSLALAEGQFTDEAVLHVTDSAHTPPREDAKGSVTWDVTLSGSGLGSGDTIPLRLLSPGGKVDVWQYQNGQWVAVDAVHSGQYLLLTMEGTQGTFFLQPQSGGLWIAVPIVVGTAAVVAVIALIAKKKAAKKKKPAAQKQ